VIIASSTASHGGTAAACAAAKTPFLCERPLAFDLETGQQIVNEVRAAGIFAAIALNRRFDAGYAGIKAAVNACEIGRIEMILVTSRTAAPPTVEFTRTSGALRGEKGALFTISPAGLLASIQWRSSPWGPHWSIQHSRRPER